MFLMCKIFMINQITYVFNGVLCIEKVNQIVLVCSILFFFIPMKYYVTKSPLASMIKCVNERCEDTYISRVGFVWFFFQEKVLMFFTLKFDFSPFVFCFLFEFIQIHLVIRR